MMLSGVFRAGNHAIDYLIGYRCRGELVRKLVEYAGQDLLLIADQVPLRLHGDALVRALRPLTSVRVMPISAEESSKTLLVVYDLLERATAMEVSRNTTVVSFGGGVTANLAGMVAGLLFRGVRLVHLPTTFLCVSDGVLSRKQAVNASAGKNLYGLFQDPVAILCDVEWLSTLARRELTAGLVELAKNALTFDLEVLEYLERLSPLQLDARQLLELIARAIASKARIMRNDPCECREGLLLEYGHTVGHALELTQPGLTHGHAVALGMRVAAQLSKARGMMSTTDVARHDALIDKVEGQRQPDAPVDLRSLYALLKRDNKRGRITCGTDEVPMILLRRLSVAERTENLPLVPVRMEELRRAVRELEWISEPSQASAGASA